MSGTGSSSRATRQFLRGEREHLVVSYSGKSQYSAGGVSSCGLAALNCARIVLKRVETSTLETTAFLRNLLMRETCEEILHICSRWTSSAHLDVEEIFPAPIFNESLDALWSDYGQLGFAEFQKLLSRFDKSTTSSAALIITRPPEIICVLKLVTGSRRKQIWASFDSHPREQHPDGAAFVLHRSVASTSHYLSNLLRCDPEILADPALQWQAQLLAQYSAHAFVPRCVESKSADDHERTLLEISLELLKLKTELTELREANQALKSDSKSLKEENTRLVMKAADLKESNSRLQTELDSMRSCSKPVSDVFLSPHPPHTRFRFSQGNMSRSPSVPTTYIHPRTCTPSPSSFRGDQPLHVAHDRVHSAETQLERMDEADYDATGYAAALQIQQQYEEEDRQLRSQMRQLIDSTPATFDCGICMDTFSEDVVARIEPCGHSFCRQCLRQYLQSKLKERRFPILCPTCSAQRGSEEPAKISNDLASQLGLSEQEFAIFIELEIARFSVPLHCRRCNQSIFVDKSEYEAQKIITCPLPGCMHAWCKACSQTIDPNGPKHSCDGSSELNHLMTQQGWKNCPGCNTPTSKNEGCNHMTCITPGCNMHFCYYCGEAIIKSTLANDIKRALEDHYSRCRIIENPA